MNLDYVIKQKKEEGLKYWEEEKDEMSQVNRIEILKKEKWKHELAYACGKNKDSLWK